MPIPYQPLWSPGRSRRTLLAALPISLLVHALLFAALCFDWLGHPAPVKASINYVSVVTVPKGSLDAGGHPKKSSDVAPPPTPPPANDDSMTVPAETPEPRASSAATPKSTPDPRLAALDKARQDAARKEALRRAAANRPENNDTGSGEESGADGNYGIPGGDWNAAPGAVPYEALVRATIESNWMPPTWILEQNKKLIAEVHIWVGFDGRIIKRRIVKKSGDTAYDASTLAAIDKTEHLPLPPEELREYLLKKGIALRFNPESKRP